MLNVKTEKFSFNGTIKDHFSHRTDSAPPLKLTQVVSENGATAIRVIMVICRKPVNGGTF